jgi:hypothetical protein
MALSDTKRYVTEILENQTMSKDWLDNGQRLQAAMSVVALNIAKRPTTGDQRRDAQEELTMLRALRSYGKNAELDNEFLRRMDDFIATAAQ